MSARGSVAGALAPLAVLATVVAAVSAGVVYRSGDDGDDDGSAGPTTSPSSAPSASVVPEGFFEVVGDGADNARLLVPDDGWSLEGSSTGIGFEFDDGSSVRLTGPATYDEDACPGPGEILPLATVGFWQTTPADESTAQEAASFAVDAWTGYAGDDDDSRLPRSEPTLAPVRLGDGSAAWTSASVLQNAEANPRCDVDATEMRAVSVVTGDQVATVVLTRLVTADGEDRSDGVGADEADEILRSVTPYDD